MKSKITGGSTSKLFTCLVLGKYSVDYFRCNDTGFIQTEDPYWLEESYADAITELDIGLVQRNIATRDMAIAIIDGWFDRKAKFVDYGGGYGLFVRLLRDVGYDFYRVDPYCVNLFAKSFDWSCEGSASAELLTAWEVFEHVADPHAALESMLKISRSILFSTELVPSDNIRFPTDWWYFIPETGQHVSLYTRSSLEFLAQKNGLNFYSNGFSLHLMTDRKIKNPFHGKARWFFRRNHWKIRNLINERIFRSSNGLLESDFQEIQKRLRSRLAKPSDDSLDNLKT